MKYESNDVFGLTNPLPTKLKSMLRIENSPQKFQKKIQAQNKDEELIITEYDTQPPPFGITLLDTPSNTLSVGFIIWINGRGAMVDPPPYTTQILKKLQIS